jgi:hypothetical protein
MKWLQVLVMCPALDSSRAEPYSALPRLAAGLGEESASDYRHEPVVSGLMTGRLLVCSPMAHSS